MVRWKNAFNRSENYASVRRIGAGEGYPCPCADGNSECIGHGF